MQRTMATKDTNKWVDVTVTEQILADNPEMKEHGIAVGDVIQYCKDYKEDKRLAGN